MLLSILSTLFPILILILAFYLFFFKEALVKWLKLKNPTIINRFIIAYTVTGALGLIINFMQNQVFFYLWMMLSVLLTAVLSFTFVRLLK